MPHEASLRQKIQLSDENEARDRIAEQILGYLLEYPSAADSTNGILHWWLPREESVSEAMVREVLEALTTCELLIARGAEVQSRVYALNEPNRDAVKRFLAATRKRRNG